jgi:hypothetical protein
MTEQPSPADIVDTRQYRHSLRLQFDYDGEALRLVEQTRVRMIAPASPVPRPKLGEQRGFWVELQNARGHTLFHRLVHNPLRASVEVHSPDGPPQILTGRPQPGSFEVLVPDIPDATTVVVCGTPLDPERAREGEPRSEELARYTLTRGERSS